MDNFRYHNVSIFRNCLLIILIVFLLSSSIKIESSPTLSQNSLPSGVDAYIVSNSISVTPINNNGNGYQNVQISFTFYSSDIYLLVVQYTITRSDNNNLIVTGSTSVLLNKGETPINFAISSNVFYNSLYSGKMKITLGGYLQTLAVDYNIDSVSYEFSSTYTDYAIPNLAIIPNSFNIRNIKDSTISNGSGYDYVIASIELNSTTTNSISLTAEVYDPSFGIITSRNTSLIALGTKTINFYFAGSLFYNLFTSKTLYFNVSGIFTTYINYRFLPVVTFSHNFISSDYNPPPIIINSSNNNLQFIDSNNDSLIDYIQIKMAVDLKINASLEITSGAFLQSDPTFGLAYTYKELNGLGNHEALLNYSGGAIYNSYFNGNLSFFFAVNIRYKNNELTYNILFFQNTSIVYSQFARPDVTLEPNSLQVYYLKLSPTFYGKYDRISLNFNIDAKKATSNLILYYGFVFNQNNIIILHRYFSIGKGNSTQTIEINEINIPKSTYSGQATFFITGYIQSNNTSDSISKLTKNNMITFNDFVNGTSSPTTSSDTNSSKQTNGFLAFPQFYFDIGLIVILILRRSKLIKSYRNQD